jgi:hypothetical protein
LAAFSDDSGTGRRLVPIRFVGAVVLLTAGVFV